MDASSLRDLTVLVHGASGAVGGELLRQLGALRARVGAVVRRPWQVADVEQALAAADVPRSHQLVAALGDDDSEAAAGLVKGIEDSLGPIAAMVSVAGAFAAGAFGSEPATCAADLWQANFAAPVQLARAVAMPMRRRRTGALVFTGAKVVLESPVPGMALYVASKAALHAFVASLATELDDHGIRVALLAPGTIDTEANRRAMPDADRSKWLSPVTVARRLLQLATTPSATPIVATP